MMPLQGMHFYSKKELQKFQKQCYKKNSTDNTLNPHCEHIIRNGQPVTLTQEQREQFARIICDIPKNPIGLGVLCGVGLYLFVAPSVPILLFGTASAFRKAQAFPQNIITLLYFIGVVLLLLVIAGFVGLCIAITKKNKKRTGAFCTEVHEKIRRGEYRAYAYRIEEIYHTEELSYENPSEGYIGFWYRIGDILIELPNSNFECDVISKTGEIILRNPEQFEQHERSHPVGGYLIGMLIYLDGKECFYGI